jgi:hypothetical protein
MKNFSLLYNLKRNFLDRLVAGNIAESLISFDENSDAHIVHKFLQKNRFDVVGIRVEGITSGFVNRDKLRKGKCSDFLNQFEESQIVEFSHPIESIIEPLLKHQFLFVKTISEVDGIITIADLEKQPLRMWLFGIISLLEMEMTKLISKKFLDDKWIRYINKSRMEKARELYKCRVEKNSEIDFLSCLQFCDKVTIITKATLIRGSKYSKVQLRRVLKDTEDLRNQLAHSNDIVSQFHSRLGSLLLEIEEIINCIEESSRNLYLDHKQ